MSDPQKPPGPDRPHRKVRIDDRGRSVWTDPIETAELELVSTQTLQTLLESGDAQHRSEIQKIADGNDGYLARDSATGHFQVIDDDSLQSILDQQREATASTGNADVTLDPASPEPQQPEELSLVSTQALRKILVDVDTGKPKERQKKFSKDDAGGFDPYNTG